MPESLLQPPADAGVSAESAMTDPASAPAPMTSEEVVRVTIR